MADRNFPCTVEVSTLNGQLRHVFSGFRNWVNDMYFFQNETGIVACDETGLTMVWDLVVGTCLYSFTFDFPVTSACISDDGLLAICSRQEDQVRVIQLSDSASVSSVLFERPHKIRFISSISGRANDHVLVARSRPPNGSKIFSLKW